MKPKTCPIRPPFRIDISDSLIAGKNIIEIEVLAPLRNVFVGNVSLVDFNFLASRDTSIDEVNALVKAAAEGAMAGVLQYNDEPLVSSDFNHQAASSIFDARQTQVHGRMVKVMAWYDNEWAFANRMLDNCRAPMAVAGRGDGRQSGTCAA